MSSVKTPGARKQTQCNGMQNFGFHILSPEWQLKRVFHWSQYGKAKTNAGERTLAQFIVLNKEYNSCFFKFTEQ